MPNRILKESICTSETIEQLNWFEETLFYRLVVNCDDYGRFDARPAILKARLFPLKERLAYKDIENALQKMSDIGCVTLYVCDNKPYLYLTSWEAHQTIRAKKSKYPDPATSSLQTPASNCKQVQADDCKCPRNPIQSESESKSNTNMPAATQGKNAKPLYEQKYQQCLVWLGDSEISPEARLILGEWLQYKRERKEGYTETGFKNFIGEFKSNEATFGAQAVYKIIRQSMGNGYVGIIFEKLRKSPVKSEKSVPTAAEYAHKNDFLEGDWT